ncbi:MAG: roadblock/LC7 family protein [Myxococcales bacterium]|nr:roadblock/LC7 family protein [Myxococcales bacterium]
MRNDRGAAMTPFAAILQRAVTATPNAIGGAFADPDGEMVDSFALIDPHDWAVLTAHYGVVLRHLTQAFGTWHYGGPEYFIAQHKGLEVIVQAVEAGYYALLAFTKSAPIALALENLRVAATFLRKEMA